MKLKDVTKEYRSMSKNEWKLLLAETSMSLLPGLGLLSPSLNPLRTAAAADRKAREVEAVPSTATPATAVPPLYPVLAGGEMDTTLGTVDGMNVAVFTDLGVGRFRVSFSFPVADPSYTVNAEVLGDVRAVLEAQDVTGFEITLRDNVTHAPVDAAFKFAVVGTTPQF